MKVTGKEAYLIGKRAEHEQHLEFYIARYRGDAAEHDEYADRRKILWPKGLQMRVTLDPGVDHIKCFWVMHGLSTAQLSLNFGADDLDGSVVEYKITHDADGYGTPDTLTREDLLELIRDAGFRPVERNTRYEVLREYDGPNPARRDEPQAVWA